MTKTALITGITGQDGSYLAELLLEKGYEVHGIKRRASLFNTQRIDHIYEDPHVDNPKLNLHYGDLTDTSNLTRILAEVKPDEVYNLGAQSHVAVSFEAPEYTADVDATGALRLLEAIRFLGLGEKTRLLGFAEITLNGGYSSGRPAIAHFGLGSEQQVDVEVTLPSRNKPLIVRQAETNQILTVREPE